MELCATLASMKNRAMDARRLSHTTLTELRKRGVGSVQDGQSPETVALALGINTYDGRLTYKAVADAFGLPYTPLETLFK